MSENGGSGPDGWVDRHGDSLYRYALLRLRAPDVAADVVQETFLEAFRTRGSFAGRSSERTWLVGILRHKIIDYLRKSGRAPRGGNGVALDQEDAFPFDERGRWRVSPKAWAGDPSRQMETREFWEVFGKCLSRLPMGLADAFLLREIDGLDADLVQQMLGITPANFWKRLQRARLLLRRCLESGWFGQRSPDHSFSSKDPARS
jgi:RNA polymerase sigma-70 factor (ECF subfamily)